MPRSCKGKPVIVANVASCHHTSSNLVRSELIFTEWSFLSVQGPQIIKLEDANAKRRMRRGIICDVIFVSERPRSPQRKQAGLMKATMNCYDHTEDGSSLFNIRGGASKVLTVSFEMQWKLQKS
ncbi:uncharacterized protein EKO05_0008970 [Ascochyta rabiei]|uniref:uncharacterized protein n=1 Tax=Didymella rabiei TaxID=5454 RepID=UPI00220F07D1|nr:uncharacterized protein EKO05_0008970 [Ascochyta rabiei]UPX18678.1 hypothetical protein EKO05_0008970 [Ascochyta rabiei]